MTELGPKHTRPAAEVPPPQTDPLLVRAAIISETIVFCTLAVLGGGLFWLIGAMGVNWYYPTIFYGIVVYIAWQRYFGALYPEELAAQTEQRVSQETLQEWMKDWEEYFDLPHSSVRKAPQPSSFPIEGYDELPAIEIAERLSALSATELRMIREYERRNKDRQYLIEQVDRKLQGVNGGS